MSRTENNPDISDHFQRTKSWPCLQSFWQFMVLLELELLGVHQSLTTPIGFSLGPHG